MPQPTLSDVHVNRPLTNVAVLYMQQQNMFVSSRIFPNVPVKKKSDLYFIYDKGDWFRSEARERAPGTESAGSGYDLTTASYLSRVIGLHKDIADQERENADQPLDMDRDATNFLMQQMMIKKDRDWAAKYFVSGVWSADVTPTALWDTSVSTPIEDIRTRIFGIHSNTGYRPNKIVFGARVWEAIVDHPEFIERIKYSEKAIVTEDLVASVLGLNEVIVAGAVENTANEGATDAFDFILGKNALLCYSAPAPSIQVPSAGYTFSWSAFTGAGPAGQRVKRFRMPQLDSDRVELEMAYDQKVVASDLGVLFEAVVS
jgi:hypothetical protein